MKVLIISLPRTGSTSLMYKIAKEKNLVPLFEPFDGSNRVLYYGQDNIVLKTIVCHHPNNIELSKEFDEVILLSRKNLIVSSLTHIKNTFQELKDITQTIITNLFPHQ